MVVNVFGPGSGAGQECEGGSERDPAGQVYLFRCQGNVRMGHPLQQPGHDVPRKDSTHLSTQLTHPHTHVHRDPQT
jgi:hypothetical protein